MKRWMFNLLAALSLILCLATPVLWVRGYRAREGFMLARSRDLFGIQQSRGIVELSFDRLSPLRLPWEPQGWGHFSGPPQDERFPNLPGTTSQRSFWGFGWWIGSTPSAETYVVHGTWWLILGAAMASVGLLYLRRRREQREPFDCRACGYDLRASPDRCPECGAVP